MPNFMMNVCKQGFDANKIIQTASSNGSILKNILEFFYYVNKPARKQFSSAHLGLKLMLVMMILTELMLSRRSDCSWNN